jgi:hypothetical protein
MYDKDGIEYLAESHAGGVPAISSATGPWARWPSYSNNGRLIVYTQIEHKVEYWVAENLTAPGSPLQTPKNSTASSGKSKLDELVLKDATLTASGGSSPVDVFHR